MKFTGLDTTSYDVRVGNLKLSDDVKKETVKFLTMIDGTVEVINYGSRLASEAEFKIINLTNVEFYTLADYLIENAGNKVLLTLENEAEQLFGEYSFDDYSEYYVYILSSGSYQEEDITCGKDLFTLTVKVALAGLAADSVPNEADSSILDVLIEVDTCNADYRQSVAPPSPSTGERYLDTDDNKLYQYNGSAWVYLYTVAADESDYGFVEGKFYFSAFSDTTYSGALYKAGLINFKGITPPGRNIDISKGPSISRKEGFSFSLKNLDDISRSWARFIIDNQINLFGAKCTMYIYETGTVTRISSGKNKTNTFDYLNYEFQIEPFSLNSDKVFPEATVENSSNYLSRYYRLKSSERGKTAFATYGEFIADEGIAKNRFNGMAALQDISSEKGLVSFERIFYGQLASSKALTTNVVVQINYSDNTKLYIRKNTDLAGNYLNRYRIYNDYISEMNVGNYSIKALFDSRGDNANKDTVRRITAIDDSGDSDYYILTINEAFPVAPTDNGGADDPPNTDDTLTCIVTRTVYRYQLDTSARACGGIGSSVDGKYVDNKLELFQLDDDQINLVEIPQTEYEIVGDGNKNYLLLNPLVAGDTGAVTTYKLLTNKKMIEGADLNTPILQGKNYGVDIPVPVTPPSPFNLRPFRRNFIYPGSETVISGEKYSQFGSSVIDLASDVLYWTNVSRANSEKVSNQVLNDLGQYGVIRTTNYRSFKGQYQIHWDKGKDGNVYSLLDSNFSAVSFEFPVVHEGSEASFLNSDNVRMVMGLKIRSTLLVRNKGGTQSREVNAPFTLYIRFRKYDGTYISNGDWNKALTEEQLNLYEGAPYGQIKINNYPGTSGFGDETSLADNFDHIILKVITLDSQTSIWTPAALSGDKLYSEESGKIFTFNGTSWADGGAIGSDKILFVVPSAYNAGEVKKTVSDGSPVVAAVSGTDYNTTPTWEGKDIFDVTDDLFGVGGAWADVAAMEAHFVLDDMTGNQYGYETSQKSKYVYDRYWKFYLEIERPINFFIADEVQVADKQIFTAARGRVLSSTFPMTPKPIITNIMDTIYPNQYNASSLDSILDSGARSQWYWRRQFTSSIPAETLLKEILQNLWACAVINTNDQIDFKSLNRDYYNADLALTDSNIIVDSFTKIKYRNVNEIYQEFKLNYDYDNVGKISSKLPEYYKSETINSEEGADNLKALISKSSVLFDLSNTMAENFNFHYKNITDLSNWIVKFFIVNSWSFKVKVSISTILEPNALDIMDTVSVNSYFHTSGSTIYGYITSIQPNFYDGTAELGIYIPEPPGAFGPLCDPFNDALNLSDRDVTGWTDANGKRNDAGRISTRSIGSYTQKDANQISTRTFDC